jgi:hypothetical protein
LHIPVCVAATDCPVEHVESLLILIAGEVALIQSVAPGELAVQSIPDQLEELDPLLGLDPGTAEVAIAARLPRKSSEL